LNHLQITGRLVTVSGEHPHPIPLPQNTPPVIRSKYFNCSKFSRKISQASHHANFLNTQSWSPIFANVSLAHNISHQISDWSSCFSRESGTSWLIHCSIKSYLFSSGYRMGRLARPSLHKIRHQSSKPDMSGQTPRHASRFTVPKAPAEDGSPSLSNMRTGWSIFRAMEALITCQLLWCSSSTLYHMYSWRSQNHMTNHARAKGKVQSANSAVDVSRTVHTPPRAVWQKWSFSYPRLSNLLRNLTNVGSTLHRSHLQCQFNCINSFTARVLISNMRKEDKTLESRYVGLTRL